jgi:putative transposase
LIEAEKANYPVSLMCRVLQVSRSGLYAWRHRPRVSAGVHANRALLARIRCVHATSRGTYGSPRVHMQLRREGVDAGRNRIARLMQADGLRGRIRRKFRTTTDSSHSHPVAPNTLNRQFEVEAPDRVWAGDITYIHTATGWAYLAVILDLYSRMVVGWSMATHMRTELIEAALRNAIGARQPSKDLLHHSDRGCQYASSTYRALLAQQGIAVSMSRRGECYDNAVVESFFGTLKQELVHHARWNDLAQARAAIHDYIEVFYNRQRLHSTLGYRTPAEADQGAA